MKYSLFALFIITLNCRLFSQVFQEQTFHPSILSVRLAQSEDAQSFPILEKGEASKLELSFDLLGDDTIDLGYRFIHCKANWEKSTLMNSQFLHETINDFYLDDYELSSSTQRLYTHYSLSFTSSQFLLSGNYIIQVFAQDNPEQILLQKRFVYSENTVDVLASTYQSNSNKNYKTKQRVQFEVDYASQNLRISKDNFTAMVLQNFRWDNAQTLKPLFISSNALKFNHIDKNGLFDGNYEFPYFDTSDISHESYTIRAIEEDVNNETHCYVNPNTAAARNYFSIKDINGNYLIAAENTFSPDIEADYTWVHLTLDSPKIQDGIYVVGRFNDWAATENYRLRFDEEANLYHIGLLLKQGIYNYTFVAKDTEGNTRNLLGNYRETENDYYIFIYYRDHSLQADRLLGWQQINTTN